MISMIAAMSENNVIGKDGKMPWHLPGDLQFFKQTTNGHSIVMGRKTFKSIGRALPKRRNIVLTRNNDFSAEGVEVINNFSEMDKLVKDEEEFFVIGGATIYEQLLPLADRLYITKIHETFEGDTFFPDIDDGQWEVVASKKGKVDETNSHAHTFLTYERKN
ncbi:dihydrofolate reductase [Salipaludibacillus neizhouensis]|uniref:Dihydrofolate reductase n=1 Tax=Salipaludibacillus neizhouensis TaxID=885475 RepID=A0A3A9KDG2_9BACI|nr:dihydrofolate reductase [Salipaludibacillus neizhouensis]RKL65475.1 dihydrofolate reductase [Salipaludibacillus neizhouensis]